MNKFIKIYTIAFIVFLLISISAKLSPAFAKKFFVKDEREKELKYQYEVLKDDEKYKRDRKILDLTPSGYMTVDEYEKMSEYKDKYNMDLSFPKIETPSDFKYVPKPLYRLVKYNEPAGSPELKLDRKIYQTRQLNAQGIVSPDFSMLVYPTIYYYPDNATIASDIFIIKLPNSNDTTLNKVMKANIINKEPDPILSTDKAIDNFAAFRTLTPVDFSSDGEKILIKEKIGSSEDGIWETIPFVYNFKTGTDYNLKAVRDAIVYFWKEYMEVDLDDNRWDIYPLGFDKSDPDRVVVQGFAFTGTKPIFLGSWSIDSKGEQSRLITFDKNYIPQVSINGYKLVKDGVESYQTVVSQEKFLKKESKYLSKQKEKEEKEIIREINDEYKAVIRSLNSDYKDEARDLKKLRSLSGTNELTELQQAYEKYLNDQWNKDINKIQQKIDKEQKKIDQIDEKLDKLYQDAGLTSQTQNSSSSDTEDNTTSTDRGEPQ